MSTDISSPAGPPLRVALLGIYHESNTFIGQPTTLEDFKNSHWLKGEDIRKEYQDSFHEIGGMLEVMDRYNIRTIPVMFAEATPGGIINNKSYALLLREMMEELHKHLPVDACLVVPHGAAVAEGYDDMDGHWLGILRETVGSHIPIVGTLDPHANLSEAMVAATNALIAYKTNPHIDQRETGRAAAELLVKFLNKEVKPFQHLVQTPVAISIEQQNTSAEPCKSLYELTKQISQERRILSVSILLGFPYADVEDMGSSFLIVSDDLPRDELVRLGDNLRSALIQIKEDCVGEMRTIGSILPLLGECKKPVLLLDMGDNIGGGSPGDSAFLLKAIESYGTYRSFICIFDPHAVEMAATHSINNKFTLRFGNHAGIKGGEAYVNKVTLIQRAEGKFSESKPRHGGQVNYDMGQIVILLTEGGNTVMINSLRVPPFSLRQLTSFGIDPQHYDIIVAKGVNAPIAAYSDVCPTIFQVNTPGVTQADMTLFSFTKRRRPLFPFEINLK